MDTQPDVQRASQQLEPGALVELFIIDLSPIGVNEQYCFCTTGAALFQGIVFAHADVETEGFEWNAQGTLPQPTIRISNATRLVSAIAKANGDLIGAKLTRIKTYRNFLDDGDTPNTNATFAPDIYSFEQKTKHNKFQVEFKLSAAMDQQGRQLPGRIVVQDFCMWRYRKWTGTAFDYSKAQCPYVGAASFDANGNPTGSAGDTPSRKFDTCCKKRFGNGPYPFGGFPGVALSTST